MTGKKWIKRRMQFPQAFLYTQFWLSCHGSSMQWFDWQLKTLETLLHYVSQSQMSSWDRQSVSKACWFRRENAFDVFKLLSVIFVQSDMHSSSIWEKVWTVFINHCCLSLGETTHSLPNFCIFNGPKNFTIVIQGLGAAETFTTSSRLSPTSSPCL